jgi:hypothetical protein
MEINNKNIQEAVSCHAGFSIPHEEDDNEELIEFLTYGGFGNFDLDGLPMEWVQEKIVDTSRWSIYYEVIVKINGKFYCISYSRGATEYQNESPFENDSSIEFFPVNEVLVKDYVKVK